jgi:phosphate transport system protein
MRTKFEEQLRQLNNEMVYMGNMIEEAIQNALDALFSKNLEKAKKIMNDDELVDRQQKKIETICFQLLVQQQPVAHDLRNITAAMKMVTDMERIGDQAADISELTILMPESINELNADDIRKMSTEVILMLIQAIDAYVEKDSDKAQKVIDHDDIVDELFAKVKGELIETMRNKPELSESAADLLMVNKYLERIGDHATNIAEWVIFSVDDRYDRKG